MNGIDYSNKYTRDKENFAQKVSSTNKAAEERVKNVEETHKEIQAKQAENYSKSRAKLEKQTEDRIDVLSNEQRQALFDKNKEYSKRLAEEKSQFHEKTKAQLKDFNTRLDSLRSKTSDNLEQIEKSNTAREKYQKENFDTRVKNLREQNERTIAGFRDNAIGDSESTHEKTLKEKRALNEGFEKEKHQLIKTELEKRNALKARAVDEVAKIRETQESEIKTNNEAAKERFESLVKNTNQTIEQVNKNSTDALEKVRDAQREEKKNSNQNFKERFAAQEKDYNNNLRKIELESRRQSIGDDSVQGRIFAKQREEEKAQRDEQVSTILNERLARDKEFSALNDKAREDFQHNYKKLRIDQADQATRIKQEASEANLIDRNKLKLEKDHLARTYDSQLATERSIASDQLDNAKYEESKKIRNLKDNYNQSLNKAQDKNLETFQKLKEEMDVEKRDLAERISHQNTEQKNFMKQNYDKKVDKLTQGYENRISDLMSQNKELRMKLESTVKDVINQSQAQVERQKENLEAARKTESLQQQKVFEAKENDLRNQVAGLHRNFSEKMTETRLTNERKLKDRDLKSQAELDANTKKYTDIIEQNQRGYEREIERVTSTHKAEKERLVSQYENQISQLKRSYDDKKDEVDRFSKYNKA